RDLEQRFSCSQLDTSYLSVKVHDCARIRIQVNARSVLESEGPLFTDARCQALWTEVERCSSYCNHCNRNSRQCRSRKADAKSNRNAAEGIPRSASGVTRDATWDKP